MNDVTVYHMHAYLLHSGHLHQQNLEKTEVGEASGDTAVLTCMLL